eukprot:sb/3463629/
MLNISWRQLYYLFGSLCVKVSELHCQSIGLTQFSLLSRELRSEHWPDRSCRSHSCAMTRDRATVPDIKDSLKSNGMAVSLGLVVANVAFISISALIFMHTENAHIEETVTQKAKHFINLKGWMADNNSTFEDPSAWIKIKALSKKRCFKDNNNIARYERFNFWTSLDFCSTIISTIGIKNWACLTLCVKVSELHCQSIGLTQFSLLSRELRSEHWPDRSCRSHSCAMTRDRATVPDIKDSLKSNGMAVSLGLVVANVAFISISALIFMHTENAHIEETVTQKAKHFINLKGWMADNNSTFEDPSAWIKIKALSKKRCFKDNNNIARYERFNFWTSLDFCSTIISTIGYGSLFPDRDIGKIACIFYALFGIPLMLCFLNVCCDAVSSAVSDIIRTLSRLFLRRNQMLALQTVRVLKVCIIFIVLSGYMTLLSYILHIYSGMDNLISCFYFYVITLTTTGIGDISMIDHDALILVRVFAVFLLGLTLVTTLINSIRDAAKESIVSEASQNGNPMEGSGGAGSSSPPHAPVSLSHRGGGSSVRYTAIVP